MNQHAHVKKITMMMEQIVDHMASLVDYAILQLIIVQNVLQTESVYQPVIAHQDTMK